MPNPLFMRRISAPVRQELPATLSNLLYWMNADKNVATDTAGTSAASIGSSFKFATDASGNGRHFSTSGTAPGTLQSVSGKRVLRFAGTQIGLTSASSMDLNLRDFTAYYVVSTTTTGFKTLLSFGASNQCWQYFSGRWITTRNGASNQQHTGYIGIGAQTLAVVTVISSGGAIRTRVNGFGVNDTVGGGALPASTVTGSAILGSLAAGSQPMNGDYRHALLYGRAHSLTEAALVENYLMNDIGVTANTAPDKVVAFDGNSVVYGTGASDERGFAAMAAERLDSSWTVVNLGVPGITTPGMATLTSQVYAARTKNINVMYEHRNYLNAGATGAQAYSAIQSKGQTAATAGWTVVILDCPPQSDLTSTKETARTTLNASLGADFDVPTGNANVFAAKSGVTYGHYLCKMATPWTSNLIHPADAEADAIAAVVYAGIVPT